MNQAFICARITHEGKIASIDIYSDAAWNLTCCGETVAYAQLGFTSGDTYGDARDLAEEIAELHFSSLRELFAWT